MGAGPAAVLHTWQSDDDDIDDPVAPANGGTVTYSFVADHPGTFLYESGTDPTCRSAWACSAR